MQEMAGVGQSNQTLKQMTPIMEDEKPGSANKIQDEDENQVLPSGAKTPYVSAEQQQLNPQNSQNLELEQEEEIRAVTLQADTFTLRIKANQRQMEELLQNMIQVQSSKTAHYMMMLLITSYFIMTLILITIRNDFFSGNLFLFFIRSCFILLLILGTFLYEKAFKVPWIKYSLFLVFLGGMAPSFLMAFYTDNRDFSAVQTLELIFIFTIASNLNLFNFVDILAFTIVETLMFIILYFVKLNLGGIIIACFTIYNLLNLMKAYMALYGNINYFNTIQVINTKKKHQEGLVSQLLPQHALQKMKNSVSLDNKLALTDYFENVTILFADIAGFTKFSNERTPKEVVEMLR